MASDLTTPAAAAAAADLPEALRLAARCKIVDMGFVLDGNPSPCHLWTGPTSGNGRGGNYCCAPTDCNQRTNTDGSVSTLVDNGDGTAGTLTTGCPKLGPLYLHKRTGVISAHPEPEQEESPSVLSRRAKPVPTDATPTSTTNERQS